MGLRERLRSRQRPHAVYRLRVDDTTDAERELREAREAHRQEMRSENSTPERLAELTARVEEAETALKGCYEEIVFRAIPPGDLEALIAAHPPTEKHEDAAWNPETFPLALFTASAEDEEMTEDDWRRLLEHDVSHGEKLEMMLLAQSVNVRAPSDQIPKG